MTPLPELSVVVPVCDEVESIQSVLEEWCQALDASGIDFRFDIYDDGSQDGTSSILEDLAERDLRLHVHRQANRGHGPTLRRAYDEARSPWVLQIDGDGELPAANFAELWAEREGYELLLGRRQGRTSRPLRTIVSRSAVRLTQLLFRTGIMDPNSPYRLMRNSWLQGALPWLPEAPFAPNLLLVGVASRRGERVLEIPIPYRGREAGRGKLNLSRLLFGCGRALRDTCLLAIRLSRGRRS